MWMLIIYFENKVNEYKGYGNVLKERVEDFNLYFVVFEDVIVNVEDFKVSRKSVLKYKIKINWKVNFKLMKRVLFF